MDENEADKSPSPNFRALHLKAITSIFFISVCDVSANAGKIKIH